MLSDLTASAGSILGRCIGSLNASFLTPNAASATPPVVANVSTPAPLDTLSLMHGAAQCLASGQHDAAHYALDVAETRLWMDQAAGQTSGFPARAAGSARSALIAQARALMAEGRYPQASQMLMAGPAPARACALQD